MNRERLSHPAAVGRRLRRLGACLMLGLVIGSACAPGASNAPPTGPSPAASSMPPHAPEIRIGLVGDLGHQNVWALFSGEEYSYNDYAVRAQYWPRLYDLTIPEQDFVPRLASGMPTAVRAEGAFQTASVPVRTDLHWTDGSTFTAQDVAFTVNAALQFELGFDWADFYDRQALDHAEAVSVDTVKFYFKSPPGVQAWQLGALRGPVVQAKFWAPKVAAAGAQLPTDEVRARIVQLQQKVSQLQGEVNLLYAQVPTAQGEQARELQADLRRQQGNLDQASNDLVKEQTGLQEALKAARVALFDEDDSGEPLLGSWQPSGAAEGAAAVNFPNPDYPGPRPNFDQAAYITYASADAARRAFASGSLNLVLDPSTAPSAPSAGAMISPSRSLRFLLLNSNASGLDAAALRRALACVVDQAGLAEQIGNAVALSSVIPTQEVAWYDPEAAPPCAGLDAGGRLLRAAEMLRAEGYSWEREPAAGEAGQGLKRPDGSSFPALRLMAPNSDEQRAGAATYISKAAAELGIPLTTQLIAPDALDYSVLSSGDFDAAVVGWRVGSYPGYLCEWFNAGGTFSYSPSTIPSLCGELQAASDLQAARSIAYGIQKALIDEVPIIPLYSVAVADELEGIAYPFESVLDGLAGVYGAPQLAIPTAQ